MGNIFSQSAAQQPNTESEFETQIEKQMKKEFPDAKKTVLLEYKVQKSNIRFYEKNKSGKMVPQSEENLSPGESVFAKVGEVFTGASLPETLYIDLGMNTYLPLNDVHTGDILLQTIYTKKSASKKKSNTRHETQKSATRKRSSRLKK